MAGGENGSPIVNQNNNGGLGDLSAIAAAISELATNTREVRSLLDAIKSNLPSGNNNSGSGSGITKADIDKLFNDYVKSGFSALESKIGNVNSQNTNNRTTTNRNFRNRDYLSDIRENISGADRIVEDFNNTIRNSSTSFITLENDLIRLDRTINNNLEVERRRDRFNTLTLQNMTAGYTNLQGGLSRLARTFNDANLDTGAFGSALERTRENLRTYASNIDTANNTVRGIINNLAEQEQKFNNNEITQEQFQTLQETAFNQIEIQERRIATLRRQADDEARIARYFSDISNEALRQSNTITSMSNDITNSSNELRRNLDSLLEIQNGNLGDIVRQSLEQSFGVGPRINEDRLNQLDTLIQQYDTALGNINLRNAELDEMQRANADELAKLGTRNDEGKWQGGDAGKVQSELDKYKADLNTLMEGSLADRINNRDRIKELNSLISERENKLQIYDEQERIIKLQQENIEQTRENLEYQRDVLEEERTNAESARQREAQGTSIITRASKQLITFIGGLVKDAITREEEYIKQAADEVYDSFERLQASIGKSLKLSSGAYDDLKEKMIEAANEVGVAVDVTQLNDAAASMADLGIRDTEILKNFAIGANILSESGSTLQLDEDISRQLLAGYNETYNKSIEAGMTSAEATKEASDSLINTFYELAAAESSIAEEFGSVSALSRGGYQTIAQWFNQLQEGGYLESTDLGEFTLSMGRYLQAMEKAGVDSSTLLSDFDTILQGNMSGLNTELQGWFQTNNLKTTEDFIQAISTNFGDVASSFEQFRASLYEDMDEMSVSYAKQSFGSNLTNMQVMGRLDKIDNITDYYEGASRNDTALLASVENIKDGLKQGTWISATEQMNKFNKSLVDDIAAEAQNLPDGKVIMDQGFKVVTDILNNIINAIGTGFGAVLTAMTTGSLTGGTGTGGAGGLSNVGNFLIGRSGTTAGNVGRAVGAVAGVGMMGYSALYEHRNEEGTERLYNTLTDPTFTSGLGIAVGGALGGPVGAAIGGTLGQFIPTIENKFEELITKDIPIEGKIQKAQLEAAEELMNASLALTEAADEHANNAKVLDSTIKSQEATFDSFNDNQKLQWLQDNEDWLRTNELLDAQSEITTDTKTNNALFEKATAEWLAQLTNKKNKEEALSEANKFEGALADVRDMSGLGLNVSEVEDDMYMISPEDIKERKRKRQAFASKLLEQSSDEDYAKIIESYGVNLSDLQTLADTGAGPLLDNLESFTSAYTAVQELMIDTKSTLSNENLPDMIAAVEKYQEAINNELNDESKITDFEQAAVEYLKATGSFDDDEAAYEAQLIANAKEKSENMTAVKEQMQKEWEKALKKDKNKELTASQLYKQLGFDTSLLSTELGASTLASDIKDISDVLTTNVSKYDNAEYVYDENGNVINGENVTNKHATGLAYVPYDEYPALLHEGEMVLNKTDADEYRKSFNSLLDTDIIPDNDITDTNLNIDTDLLTKQYNDIIKDIVTDNTNINPEYLTTVNTTDITEDYNSMLQEIMDNISNADVATAETYGAITNTNNTNISNNFDVSTITESVDNQTNSVTDILNKIFKLLLSISTSSTGSTLPKSLLQYDSNLNRL